jgi:serine/threonine-protein kinase RsbW
VSGRLRLAAGGPALGQARTWLLGRCAELRVVPALTLRLEVVVEEVVANVTAYGGKPPPTIEIGLAFDAACVELTFEDNGVAFDPTVAPAPSLDQDVVHRELGGLGIPILRGLMDDVRYSRHDGRNHLILRKHV